MAFSALLLLGVAVCAACDVAAFSVLIIPFLYLLSKLTGVMFMPMGVRLSLLCAAYLWCAYLTFRKLKARGMAAAFSLERGGWVRSGRAGRARAGQRRHRAAAEAVCVFRHCVVSLTLE